MKLRWSETATDELEEIFAYILDQSPASAKSVAQRILRRARSLRDFPYSGRELDVPGVRRLVVGNYPYVILYEIHGSDDEVLIVSVGHTARKQAPAED
jgi:addiction module RelE/StbE family toxin